MTTSMREEQATAAYGRSLLLRDGDLVIEGGRLREIAGLANLEQGLLLRLHTTWGSDRLNAHYGLDVSDVFTAGLTRALTKEILRLNLVRTLAGDPRVASVDQVLFDDDAAYVASHPEAAGSGHDRRLAMADVVVTPIVPGPSTTSSPASMAALAAGLPGGSGTPDTLTLLVDVRW